MRDFAQVCNAKSFLKHKAVGIESSGRQSFRETGKGKTQSGAHGPADFVPRHCRTQLLNETASSRLSVVQPSSHPCKMPAQLAFSHLILAMCPPQVPPHPASASLSQTPCDKGRGCEGFSPSLVLTSGQLCGGKQAEGWSHPRWLGVTGRVPCSVSSLVLQANT